MQDEYFYNQNKKGELEKYERIIKTKAIKAFELGLPVAFVQDNIKLLLAFKVIEVKKDRTFDEVVNSIKWLNCVNDVKYFVRSVDKPKLYSLRNRK